MCNDVTFFAVPRTLGGEEEASRYAHGDLSSLEPIEIFAELVLVALQYRFHGTSPDGPWLIARFAALRRELRGRR